MSLISPLGEELRLATNVGTPGDFRVMDGTTGFGIPAPTITTSESAGDGRRVGNVRVSGRIITLAVDVLGTNRTTTETNLNRLADAISYVDGKPLPRLRVTYDNGAAREVEFLHIQGGAESFADDEKSASWILTLDCPDPYLTDTAYDSFTVQQTATPTGFLESLPRVYLMPSNAAGVVTLTNHGRVESWIDWELQGPFTKVTVSTDAGGWEFEDDVLDGETIFVRKTPAGIEVVDNLGDNRFGSIGDVPTFFRMPAGQSEITVSVLGADESTKVIGRFKPRYRLVF
jgi:hypothetical protein